MTITRKLVSLLLLFWATSDVALAFKPTSEQYGHTMITRRLLSPGGYSFGAFGTVGALVVPQFAVGGTTFSTAAVHQIVEGAQSRDWLGYDECDASTVSGHSICKAGRNVGDYLGITVTGDIDDEAAHFDNDNFLGGVKAIHQLLRSDPDWEAGASHPDVSVVRLLQLYVRSAIRPEVSALQRRQMLIVARMKLGKALHTLQDFYAHSTWADVYPTSEIASPLTDALLISTIPTEFKPSGHTFLTAYPADGSYIDVCAKRITELVGTWEGNGGNWEILPEARQGKIISSSAWGSLAASTVTGAASDFSPTRCDHGSDLGNKSAVSGIAKDAPYMPFDPGTHCTPANGCRLENSTYSGLEAAATGSTGSHLKASYQAALHSRELLNRLVQIIRTDSTIAANPTEAESMISALLGVEQPVPRIAMLVDASGSMSTIIPGISAGLGKAASTSGVSLHTFDGNGTIATEHDDLNKMQTLLANAGTGGAGCETPALSALLKVVDELPAYSSLYLFTDAGASDADKLNAVVTAAAARHIKINPVVFGGCGLPDAGTAGVFTASTKVYYQLRFGTGGRGYQGLPDRGPAQKRLAEIFAYEAILSQAGPLQSHAVGGGISSGLALATNATNTSTSSGVLLVESGVLAQARTVSFPVDSGLAQLIVTVSAVGAQVSLVDPSGQAVALTDSGGGMIYTSVSNPAAGSWKLAMTTTAQVPYTAQIEVRGGVLLKNLQYEALVEIGARSGHEYAPSMGSTPTSGVSKAKVQIDGATGASVVLSYVNEDGTVISTFPLTLVAPTVFMGQTTVPTSAYWVKVTGQGLDGSNFARMWRGEHTLPAPMPGGRIVVNVPGGVQWTPGTTGQISMRMSNLGADENLTLSARFGSITVSVTPSTITMAANTAVNIDLSTALPANASSGKLILKVTSSTGPRDVEVPIVLQAPTTGNPTRLINLSTRGQVQTGNNVMIGGFVIGGSTAKKVLIRAVGPNLANYGVTGVLANPTLELHKSSDNSIIASNDDWGTSTNAAEISASTLAPVDSKEAAILATLNPGAYTAIVTGNGGGTGVGIVEVYELDHPEIPMINISTRGQVLTGSNVMIGGFIIQGTSNQTVLIRAVGPNLANYGVTGVLANPTLELHKSSDNSIIATNDNWGTASNAAAITATGLAPVSPLESAILISLPPGAYTAVVSGANGGTGVGIIEVFAQ